MTRSDELRNALIVQRERWKQLADQPLERPGIRNYALHEINVIDEALTRSNDEPTEAMIEAGLAELPVTTRKRITRSKLCAIYNAMRSAS